MINWDSSLVRIKLEEYIKEGFSDNELGYTYDQLATKMNDDTEISSDMYFSGEAIRSFCRRNNRFLELKKNNFEDNIDIDIVNEEKINYFKVNFLDKKIGKVEWREWLDHLIDAQKLNKKASFTQDVANVEIKTDEPVGIVYSADWHFGSGGGNYERFRKDIEFILNHDNLKLALVGDLIDGFNSFRNVMAVHQQLIPPKMQKQVIESLLNELYDKDKIICSGFGNHDSEFDEKVIGHSVMSDMQSKLVPFFNGKGILKLKIGEQEYTNLLMHKTRFSSFYNALHGAKRSYQLDFPADVIITAHRHNGAFEEYNHYDMLRELGYNIGGTTFLIQLGAYKKDDVYQKRYYKLGTTKVQTDTVIYFPNENRKLRFQNAEDAITYMNGIKEGDEK